MTPTSPISVTFVNQLEEHQQAQHVLYSKGIFYKLDKIVAVLLFGFGIYAIARVGWRWWTVIWFPLAVAEWFNLLSPTRLRTRIQFQREPKYREEYCLTFSNENIHFKTATIDSTLEWTYYIRVIESPTLFLLMYGRGLYTLVPKRCFQSDAETDAFRVLLKEKVDAFEQVS